MIGESLIKITILLSTKKNVRGLILPNFKIYYKAILIKTTWIQYKGRPIDQQNRIESSDINPYIYNQLIFLKTVQCCFLNKWSSNKISKCKRMKLDLSLIPHTKINSKWTKYLNVKAKTIKQL